MKRSLSWRMGLSAGTLAVLTSCGGETLALLGFLGAAGGDWIQDDRPDEAAGNVGLQIRSTCGPFGNEQCGVNIQPVGTQDLYATDFDLTFNSANLPGCTATGTGRATGQRMVLTNCFSGQYVTINQVLSDDRTVRMFFNFTPDLVPGVWTEIQSGQRRFAFSSNSTGCQLGTPARTVDVVISAADITNVNGTGPFETTISSFTIQGDGAAWQGRFNGISAMRLTRGSEVLELERRNNADTCPP
jgi:hypothetical protein